MSASSPADRTGIDPPLPGEAARVLARLDEVVGAAEGGQGGALWRLAESGRQLDANVVRLLPGAAVAEHVEPELDVLLHVLTGAGRLLADGVAQELTPGALVWLPRGSRRSVAAGEAGLLYLTVHRRRPGLTIRPAAAPGTTPEPTQPEGGEAACLLHLVCPECGRLSQERDARFCARCGTELAQAY
ncbi:hypothetical protein CFP65_0562 [Kitasatospora sp. MMS16-BH015]|uniref:zinc-ribbon domain-containing protein n=1 Tax=Kitasatospora sp. MMS16-BH015 TaxID=2018025 RepID=UPI000CA26F66|nr:zinc-ribbon domain-containing protein [Kitasatospora sp. MMS16-BH015]AUG75524.1 hypothetical protein CFP65_0562 [Kitasatospora sp. MMS16-BH015]